MDHMAAAGGKQVGEYRDRRHQCCKKDNIWFQISANAFQHGR